MNYYDTSIQMCGQYCILAPMLTVNKEFENHSLSLFSLLAPLKLRSL